MYAIDKSFSIEYFIKSQILFLSRKLLLPLQWDETGSFSNAVTNEPIVLAPGDRMELGAMITG
jgi:hypothetical protein